MCHHDPTRADPDIAELYRVTVILKSDRQAVRVLLVGRAISMRCWTSQFLIVLYQNAVVENSDARSSPYIPVRVEVR